MRTGNTMRRFWDDRARENAYYFINSELRYGRTDVEEFWASGERDLARLLGEFGIEVGPEDEVLEIGCGIGRMTRPLAERAGRVIGLDVSAEMLVRARAENPAVENVEWVHGDGQSLASIPDRSVDGVLSFVVLQHIPDPEVVLGYVREMGRVLRPGGWALFQVNNDERVPRRRIWENRWALRSWLRSLIGRAPKGRYSRAWLGCTVEVDDLRETARSAGMTVERVTGEGQQQCLILARRS